MTGKVAIAPLGAYCDLIGRLPLMLNGVEVQVGDFLCAIFSEFYGQAGSNCQARGSFFGSKATAGEIGLWRGFREFPGATAVVCEGEVGTG